jgi:hypothetical protein
MRTIMKLDSLVSIDQMEAFLNGSQAIIFAVAANKDDRCLYPTTEINKKGKEIKRYKYENMMPSYEKFKSIKNAKIDLKERMTF